MRALGIHGMFNFRGKLIFNKSTFFVVVFLVTYYYLTNFVFLDVKYLTDVEYTVLFYLNGLLCIFFSVGSENPKLSFMDDDNDYYKTKSEIKVGFYFAVIAFSLWYIFYEEFIKNMYFNSTSAIAVLAITISVGRLVTQDALSEETEVHKMHLTANFKQSKLSGIIYFIGCLIALAIFLHGSWLVRV
jgi:hypothetical protein